MAAALLPPGGWASTLLARIGEVSVKLFPVDPAGLAEEVHPGWSESLIMLEGSIALELDGEVHSLEAGQHILIGAGQRHSIRPGGRGVFVLVDPEPCGRSTC